MGASTSMSTVDSSRVGTFVDCNRSKMCVLLYLVLAVISAVQIRGTNIMLNKPSVQDGSHSYEYPSSKANDGNKTGPPSIAAYRQDPYWQGDLQDFYTVTSISVTSPNSSWAGLLKGAIIGVSGSDVSCSSGEVTRYGQWPQENLPGHTLVFNRSHAGPVRYVRIWRMGVTNLALGEVEVEGEPSRLTGTNIMLNKPSVQLGSHSYKYTSSKANDGNKIGNPSVTTYRQDPYWQGDLQGFYTVTSISVLSPNCTWAGLLKGAIIGVSGSDVSCSAGEVTRCGQWPQENLPGHTLVFNCSHAGPVRYVRIWRMGVANLALGEVEVKEEPSRLTGTNIMLNKPSVQLGSHSYKYTSSKANDGNKIGNPSATAYRQDPYWQGDLQGFYTVTSISVLSPNCTWAGLLKGAIIGVSGSDVSCSAGVVTRCGQWPQENLPGHTLGFNCSHAGPVRYVRIWRMGVANLALGEVEVEGEPSRLTGTVYDKVMLQKVTTPTTSLSVANVTGCGTMCHRTQPCLAFSFSPFEQPNCLLTTDVTMTSDMKWVSYKVKTCFKVPPCGPSG